MMSSKQSFNCVFVEQQKWHPVQVETLEVCAKYHVLIQDLYSNPGPVGLSWDCMPSIYYGTMVPS